MSATLALLTWDTLPRHCHCQVAAALSPRERQVVLWLATGRSTREIGAAIGISPKTIEAHKDRNAKKLGTHTAVQALAMLVHRGVITPAELSGAEPQGEQG